MNVRPALLLLLLAVTSARAQFHDQGMLQVPAVTTDYADPATGTASSPLVIGTCLWNNCASERTVYPRSDYWSQNLPCTSCIGTHGSDLHWTLLLNNEPRNDQRNPGPPDASLPRLLPGHGLMGFQTLHGEDNFAGDTYWRAHLVLDFLEMENPVHGGIPFLGFGDFSVRGNRGKPLGYLQPSSNARPSVLSFQERLWDATPPVPIGGGQPATLASYVWVLAAWGTTPKAVFVTLYHYNIQNSVPPGNPAVNHFSWPFAQSVLYPGSEIVYIDAEDMAHYCGFELPLLALHQDVAYRIDLTQLFACANRLGLFTEPMPPDRDIPVTQVLWANESTGLHGDLWTDVHDPRMRAAPSITAAPAAAKIAEGSRTAAIRQQIRRQCRAAPGCEHRAAMLAAGRQADMELPLSEQPSRPQLLQTAVHAEAPLAMKNR
jgi:hypothetical protein